MDSEQNTPDKDRRRLLKGMLGLPLAGGALLGAFAQNKEAESILNELKIEINEPDNSADLSGDAIRLGIIGYGGRGSHLSRALGFATKEWLEVTKKNQRGAYKAFMKQEKLNVKLTAVCDVFDLNAEAATTSFEDCKRYKHHEDLLNSKDVDAVIIATPDHWHAPIAIKALQAGKHVYVEKPMTHKIKEIYELRDAVLSSGKVFQVGHQHRQTLSFLVARDIIRKKILGHVSIVEVNTNRNSDNGAWQYDIHRDASPATINWEQFIGNAPMIPFNREHFFRWRKWWFYGSGLTGDLMTHDYDRINCVLDMGIPKYVSAEL